jgi:antitoxin component YwqK of YwqJK toxin-antitoxin module
MYEAESTKPYTGQVFELHANGQKAFEGIYKDGFRHGDWTYYTDVGNGKYNVAYTAGTYTVVVFMDNLGTDYTGSPVTDNGLSLSPYIPGLRTSYEPEQDGTYLFNDEDKYNFSKFPESFGTYKNGKKDGLHTGWYENGQKEYEWNYKDGEQDGLHTYWYENGQKSWERTYKDDEYHGLLTTWYDNGQKKKEGTYKKSRRFGTWTEWYANGQKKSEGTFKDGKKDGLHTGWYENGEKKWEHTYKDGEHFLSNSWDKNGKIMVKDGNGLLTYWSENGQKSQERTYKDGKDIGRTTWYYYDNGQKSSEYTYKDGKKEGIETQWYENGQKSSEYTYKDGKKDGLHTGWYENGQKEEEGTYKDGTSISKKCWDEDGNECECFIFSGCK